MKKESHKISTTVLCAITAFAFSAGAITAGWAVGVFSTAGNAADWIAALGGVVAAVGTWAIGIGANNYAREAHLQRLAERQSAQKSECDALTRRFATMKLKIIGLTFEHGAFCATADDEPVAARPRASIRAKCDALIRRLERATLSPDEIVLLDEDTQRSYKILELQMQLVSQFAELTIKTEHDDAIRRAVDDVVKELEELVADAGQFLETFNSNMTTALAAYTR
ncbi:hypothetical protein [Stenotrophomonas maltophilia]|uniref:hypothetical protein n=1 Tax=Stenotrophomonas maltophilia TaxID=40324 RepID=UPI000DBE3A13|nr:hypothetical protein [Stenotrophomonas maltophilia]